MYETRIRGTQISCLQCGGKAVKQGVEWKASQKLQKAYAKGTAKVAGLEKFFGFKPTGVPATCGWAGERAVEKKKLYFM